ncbi:MAG: helix-turn-helix domain-containing protein [Ruminococcus sp.]|nr:helix-turn-helix domain-containing protein [Ruminococcus sp.]
MNDAELVKRAKNGDSAAMDELYRAYSDRVKKFIM